MGSEALQVDGADVPVGEDYVDPADRWKSPYDLIITSGVDVPSGADDLVVNAYGLRRAAVFKVVPGLEMTLTVPPDAITVITASGGVTIPATSAQEYSAADVTLIVDDYAPLGAYQRVMAARPINIANWNVTATLKLPPGQHRFAVKARGIAGAGKATVGGTRRSAALGTLNVMFVKR